MSHAVFTDVVSADELARAARAPRALVDALIDAGELRPIPGTTFFAAADAVRIGRRLRPSTVAPAVNHREVRASAAADAELYTPDVDITPAPLFANTGGTLLAPGQARATAFASSSVHAALVLLLVWLTSGSTQTATIEEPREETRLVFLVTPGPGGGGGGGGMRNPLPAPTVQRRGPERQRVAVPKVTPEKVLTARTIETPKPTPVISEPKPVERAPEPLPSRVLVAPVVAAATNTQDRAGVIENGRGDAPSEGSGAGGGAGTGQGTGNGEGTGSGIGDGSGGGTGGGPFRPGSGIEPPRLLREVKADYTDEARRRGITGDVVMEIVVTRAGGVGDVRVLQGLGAGLDQRAIAAVRQWKFSPARRRGEAVDVIVEVAVEFTLR